VEEAARPLGPPCCQTFPFTGLKSPLSGISRFRLSDEGKRAAAKRKVPFRPRNLKRMTEYRWLTVQGCGLHPPEPFVSRGNVCWRWIAEGQTREFVPEEGIECDRFIVAVPFLGMTASPIVSDRLAGRS
jgi:hypothetical protein